MLTLGIGGCNDKTGMAAWGAGMNKNIAWILAILFGGAALGTWYLGRDTQTVDPAVIAADGMAEPAPAQTDTTTSDTSATTSPTLAQAGTDNGSDVSDTDASNTGTQEPSAPNATVADQTDPNAGNTDEGSTNTVPVLETARIDADGAVVIAGRADPGAQVEILVDDVVVETVTADSMGNFVALFDLPQSTVARSLTLRVGAGERMVYAPQDIIVAPSQIKAVQAIPETTATAPISASDSDSALATQQSERQTVVASIVEGGEPTTEQPTKVDDTSGLTVTDATGETGEIPENTENTENADLQQPAPAATQDAVDTEQAQMDGVSETDTETPKQSQTDLSPSQPTVFAADASGVKVLQGGETVPTDQIVMDAISYDAAGGVILSGRGQAGAVLQFYLDNALTQTAQIDAQGYWAQDMSSVAPGIYTLRLDQLDGAGQVTARFETPFKREDRAALAAAAAQVAQQAADATAAAQEQSVDTGTMAISEPTAPQSTAIAPVQAITVQPGNTLWGISRARYGQGILYVRVFDANRDKIRDPDLIYPGQVFVLPSQAE